MRACCTHPLSLCTGAHRRHCHTRPTHARPRSTSTTTTTSNSSTFGRHGARTPLPRPSRTPKRCRRRRRPSGCLQISSRRRPHLLQIRHQLLPPQPQTRCRQPPRSHRRSRTGARSRCAPHCPAARLGTPCRLKRAAPPCRGGRRWWRCARRRAPGALHPRSWPSPAGAPSPPPPHPHRRICKASRPCRPSTASSRQPQPWPPTFRRKGGLSSSTPLMPLHPNRCVAAASRPFRADSSPAHVCTAPQTLPRWQSHVFAPDLPKARAKPMYVTAIWKWQPALWKCCSLPPVAMVGVERD